MPFVSSTLQSFEKWRSPLSGATGNFNHQILPYGILFLTFISTNVFYLLSFKLLTIVVSLRTWGKYMTGKGILFFCDNEASVQVLISGHTRDAFMQNCLKEKAMVLTS
jgi:hypothetical protein